MLFGQLPDRHPDFAGEARMPCPRRTSHYRPSVPVSISCAYTEAAGFSRPVIR